MKPEIRETFTDFLARCKKAFELSAFCFDKQLAFVTDPSPFKTAVCSRRAGKTVGCAAHLIHTARSKEGIVCLYITLSRTNAKRLIWTELKKINDQFLLGGSANESELSMKFANGSVIYVAGAHHASEIEKFRGLPLYLVYVDECFHPDTLVETTTGPKRIADIQVGEMVKNANGSGRVNAVSKKVLASRIDLTFGGQTVKCSLNHPFMTRRGWVEASELKQGDLLLNADASMRIMRGHFPKAWPKEVSVLQRDLQREERGQASRELQSNVEPGDQEKGFAEASGDGMGAANKAWQWPWANRTRENPSCCPSGTKMEPRYLFGRAVSWLSNLLQSGLGFLREENRFRDRRKLPPGQQPKSSRQEEDFEACFTRLDNIQVHESAGDDRNPEGYFYDLSVDGHPSYTVNGVLVHNCQSFRQYIKALVDDVIGPALFDYAGTLCMTGTPGPVPAGYFYDCAHNPQWSHHAWTMFENPWITKKSGLSVQELLDREMTRKGVTIEHPSIQRECFGRWVVDGDALVFKYDPNKNDFRELPASKHEWQHVIGVDLGFDDADAIAVIAWNAKSPACFLVEEIIVTKQGVTELAVQLENLVETYSPQRIVMDTGGLGKKIAEEIRMRFSIPVVAAEKVRKFEFIELLNDALRTGKFMAKKDSAFAQDCSLVEWDRDPETQKRNPDKPEVSDKYHSDICDAVLYGFRECLHWLHEPEAAIIERNSPQFFQREVDRMEEAALEIVRQKGLDEPPEPLDSSWGWG